MTNLNLTNKEASSLLQTLEDQVLFASQFCLTGDEQTLAKICGPSFWREFEGTEHNRLGVHMKKLVASKRVPFVFVGTNSANHALYERIYIEV